MLQCVAGPVVLEPEEGPIASPARWGSCIGEARVVKQR
jgi:hypothetical protein